MSKTISVELGTDGIKKLKRELENYKRQLQANELAKRLAEVGFFEASVRFANAIYDGENDSSCAIEPIENGYKITVSGEAAWFIEFGAGVYHNGAEPYPSPPGRPEGVSPIGTFGKGYGSKQGWTYVGNPGSNGKVLPNGRVFTRGNPAAMPLYYATEEMKNRVFQIAKEVLG